MHLHSLSPLATRGRTPCWHNMRASRQFFAERACVMQEILNNERRRCGWCMLMSVFLSETERGKIDEFITSARAQTLFYPVPSFAFFVLLELVMSQNGLMVAMLLEFQVWTLVAHIKNRRRIFFWVMSVPPAKGQGLAQIMAARPIICGGKHAFIGR